MTMTALPSLDIDVLRTFILIAEDGSFTRAAEQVGRTQSAVSLQIQKLEAVTGHRLFTRSKGGVVKLTPHGRELLERVRNLVALNDEIVGTLRALPAHTEVRIGVPEDITGLNVARMLADYSARHPGIAVEVIGAPSCAMVPLLQAGDLDLMMCEAGIEPRRWPSIELWRGRLRWIAPPSLAVQQADPLPLVLSPGNCPWRSAWLDECQWRGAALRALEKAGRRYWVVATSSSLADQYAIAATRNAVAVSTLPGIPDGLVALEADAGLPDLPESRLLLLTAKDARQPISTALANHLVAAFRNQPSGK